MEEEDEDEGNKPISEEPRKSSREKVPNKRFEDYEHTSLLLRRMNFSLPPMEKSLRKRKWRMP